MDVAKNKESVAEELSDSHISPEAGAPAVVASIHLAAATRLPMRAVDRVVAQADKGLVGDRYYGAHHRQVTVQSTGELTLAAAESRLRIDPGLTRRNITINAAAVPRVTGHRWKIGSVELEVTRDAAPCRLMEDIFGSGARASLRGRAGVACRVITSGEIVVGDSVDFGDLGNLG